MSARIDLSAIPADVRKTLGLKTPRAKRSMTVDAVRSASIRVLHQVHELTPAERTRVLRHALKMNDV